jgi:hypothetical protein
VLMFQPIVPLQGLSQADLPGFTNEPAMLEGGVSPPERLSTTEAQALTDTLRSRNPDLGAGYEVLLRLKDHQNELISPSAFMPTAERFGLMADIDRWVIDRAFRALREVSRGERIVFAINRCEAVCVRDRQAGAVQRGSDLRGVRSDGVTGDRRPAADAAVDS